jgi:glyoxylase-like metal-dependent hydrolase (beta-lactamase superfamily II)
MIDTTTPAAAEVYGMPVGPLESNCYLVVDPVTRKALLIDPGADPQRISEWCALHHAEVELVLNTHGHGDHIGANGAMRERYGAKLGIHAEDAPCLEDPFCNLSAYFEPVTSPPADFLLEAGALINWEGPPVRVLHTPGHSPGSVSFAGNGWVVCGDVLFRGSIGRTDFPRCSAALLQKSIREQLMILPPETVVYPGHGPATTIGYERENNPFLHLG